MSEDVVSSSDERDDHDSQKFRPWVLALRLAEACQRQFEEPVADLDGIEQRGITALENLKKRYSDCDTHLT